MTQTGWAVEIASVHLGLEANKPASGAVALEAMLQQAESYIHALRNDIPRATRAIISRVRGTGPGVSFGSVVETIRSAFPVEMRSPFEGSRGVTGGVLLPDEVGLTNRNDGLLFLQFEPHTGDLPVHTHENSDRMIYVLAGRGYFHVAAGTLSNFVAPDVRHVPVRSRDVLLFKRGTVHTFSTGAEPMSLLSYHAPLIALDDPHQYTLPKRIVLPVEFVDESLSRVTCDPAWSRLA